MSDQVEDFLNIHSFGLNIQTVHNQYYSSTNNIYSLWLASPLIQDSFALIECDLIFEKEVIKKFKTPNRIALDRYNPVLHNGTTASICDHGYLQQLHFNKQKCEKTSQFKTVNITSLCNETWDKLKRIIEVYIQTDEVNTFYERAIQELIHRNEIQLKMIDFGMAWWDEIDTPDDLKRASKLIEIKKPANEFA